jgi:hypothetical protein
MPLLARATPRGGLSFGGAEIDVAAYAPGWSGIPIKADWSKTGEGSRAFELRGEQTYFRGHGEWTPQPDGSLRGHVEAECVAPVEMQCLAVAVRIPAPPPFGLGDASAATFDLPLDGGRTARLSFPEPVPYHSQDSRQWSGQWTVRFGGVGGHLGHGGIRTFSPGERIVWDMTLTAPDGMQSIAASHFLLDKEANPDHKIKITTGNNAEANVVVFPHRKFKVPGTYKLTVYRRAEKADNYGFLSLATKVTVSK